MKNYKFFTLGLITLSGLSITSCSDDDEPKGGSIVGYPSTETVFTNGLPSNVSGATFKTNDKNQVTQITDGSEVVTFEYGNFTPSRAHNFTVLMKERDKDYPQEGSDIYMELNAQGYVIYAYQVYQRQEDGTDEWWFEYDGAGHMTRAKRSESGDDFKITYANGNITKVVQDEDDGDHHEYTFKYTNSSYTTAVANKGCIMLFDDFFQVDIDEMGVAYFAGLLGKATTDLPMGYDEKSKEGHSTYTYSENYLWTFNANGYPTKFKGENDPDYEAETFTWK